tara:strand:+ start:3345 stop:4418 length:1074 start_codon:yes stop_codon:yes gene_type:complete
MTRKKKNKLPNSKNRLKKKKDKLPNGKDKLETPETFHELAQADLSLSKKKMKVKPPIPKESGNKRPNDSQPNFKELNPRASKAIEKTLSFNQSIESIESKHPEKVAISQESSPHAKLEEPEKIYPQQRPTEKKKGRFHLQTMTFLLIFGFGGVVYYLTKEKILNIDKLIEQVYSLSNKISSLKLLNADDDLATHDPRNIKSFQDEDETTVKKHHDQVQVESSTNKLVTTPTVSESNGEDIETSIEDEGPPPAPILEIPDEEIVMDPLSDKTVSGKSLPIEKSADEPLQIAFVDDTESTKKNAASSSAQNQPSPNKERELSPGAKVYVDFVEKAGEIVFALTTKGANASINFLKKIFR